MSLIRPLRGLRPKAEFATDVVAPPYDVLNTEEARQRAAGRPHSFLHISKPEIDLPEGTNPFDASVYQKGADNLSKLVNEKILIREDKPVYYAYRLDMNGHKQVGLVAVASVKDYDSNRIRKHEYTRPEKEDDRVNQIDALNAQTGPVFLTYRQDNAVDDIVNKVMGETPLYDLTADDGVQHTIWVIDDEKDIAELTAIFDAMNCLYIADGHHRSAAASRVAALRNKGKKANGDQNHDYFLTVIFPDNQMMILDYNRVIKDLNGLSKDEFLRQCAENFEVQASDQEVKPEKPNVFGMYLDNQWYRLVIKDNLIPQDDPVRRLDVSLLQNNLITPILAIDDPRRDKRIDFVGGIRGLGELEKRVNSGEMQVAFALHATQLSDLMAVADAEEVMPPKSTWFEPKLADGLISHVLD
ncbi:Related to HTH domain of SpoOJ/ParA/ParB/repB family, involved in chromosome partitioning [hydrothermal vent metagenome]|uniref:Related to HTH domain of SpoOJ/ParA/ParB/repB family, involved in chromosome partitioning n=1 Tax=hydrothermal vent metagenome TaxID=652676 RepID=A0A3B1ANF2_9ZZZZ